MGRKMLTRFFVFAVMLTFSLVLGCGGQEKVNFKESQQFLAVDFNNEGTILAGISKTGAVILWDAIKQSKIQSLESKDRKASSLDFNKDGSLLAQIDYPVQDHHTIVDNIPRKLQSIDQ